MDTSREIVVVTGRWIGGLVIDACNVSTRGPRAKISLQLRWFRCIYIYKKASPYRSVTLCMSHHTWFIYLSVLLGFGPFRQYVVNPSWEAAKVQQSHFLISRCWSCLQTILK